MNLFELFWKNRYENQYGGSEACSNETLKTIDCEIKKVIDESKEKCEEILKNNTDQLEIIAQALLKYETLTGDEIKKLLNGEEIQQEQEIKIEAGHSLIVHFY